MYQEYILEYKERIIAAEKVFDMEIFPQERTLQDALRGGLQDMGTGVSDCNMNGVNQATPQDENLLAKLKQSDTYQKRKMSDFIEKLASRTANTVPVVVATENAERSESGTGSGNMQTTSSSVSFPLTKKEILKSAVESMDKMTAVEEAGSKDLMKAVQDQNVVNERDIEGKNALSKGHLESMKGENAQRTLQMLVLLKKEGFISEDEFTRRAKAAAGLE